MITYISALLKDILTFAEHAANYGCIIYGTINLIWYFIAIPLVSRFSRRKMLTIGMFGTAVCNVIVSVLYLINGNVYVKFVFMILFLLFYNLGPEPIVYILFSELFPESVNVKFKSVGFAVLWGVNIGVMYAFDYFIGGLEWVVFLLFAIMTLVFGLSAVITVPETFGK